jgi:saccharopine dehydrogenase (NAD+, L-lysine forming)
MFKIGLIREEKIPQDSRVVLSPELCRSIMNDYEVGIFVQPSEGRCFTDDEYRQAGARLKEDLSDCDVLLGVKEVPEEKLIPGKWYFMFSHTIKAQPYNQQMFGRMMALRNTLTDYEKLTDVSGARVIAFGKFAGMVGAHNGLWTYGKRTAQFDLPRLYTLKGYAEAKEIYSKLQLPAMKVVLTGKGRVANGARMVLLDMGMQEVDIPTFLQQNASKPVFCQIDFDSYVAHKTKGIKFSPEDFFNNPTEFYSVFQPFTKAADLMIHGIYWDHRAPAMFSAEEMTKPDFSIKVIADITCDIAPETSIPATLKPTTIEDPVFGYDPQTGKEVTPYQSNCIDMMTIDNLPNELPADASRAFGDMFATHVLPGLLQAEKSEIIQRATILQMGQLTAGYQYLSDYAGINISKSH